MSQYIVQALLSGSTKLAVIGLGYVGLPAAIEFSKYIHVIGFDIDQKRIRAYQNDLDSADSGVEEIQNSSIEFTSDPGRLREAQFVIVAVPTPTAQDRTPDFSALMEASRIVGENLAHDAIVVFESTVYPGVTEELCVPVIEQVSGLKCGQHWKIGYSPERINPGDPVHTFSTVRKIVSGMDKETTEEIQKVYELAVKAGTYPVSTIRTAEAVKVMENSQRDVNIAFMNECSKLCDKSDIDTYEVFEAMKTKWNGLAFQPGLVGGHCVGEDSYYLLEYAKKIGCSMSVLSHGRNTNEAMADYIACKAVEKMMGAKKDLKDCTVLVWGITFKENCSDIRNSKAADLIAKLRTYQINPIVTDEWADLESVREMYGIELVPFEKLPPADCIIVVVGHQRYQSLSTEQLLKMYKTDLPDNEKILLDIKSLYSLEELNASGLCFWRL